MITKSLKISVSALVLSAMAGSALAGGFSRGTADTDILFDEGNVATRMGVTVVAPSQKLSRNNFAPSSGDILGTYVIPSFAAKFQITDAAACAATYTTPFGGSSSYADTPAGFDQTSNVLSVSQNFETQELGATCSYAFDIGPGKLHIIGGIFAQALDFEQDIGYNSLVGGATARLSLSDMGAGYRVGAAYEVKEIAFRTQLMYRSSVDVSANGNLTNLLSGDVLNPAATGEATFPQSVELKFQSGVAPGWLVFGGLKWTEWSVFEVLQYNATGTPASLNFFYRDGWTANMGVAHKFSDEWAASASFTYDRGVSTGHDINATSYSLATGAAYTPNENTELRFGVGYSYIESGEQNFAAPPGGLPGEFVPTPGIKTAKAGYAVAGSVALKLKF